MANKKPKKRVLKKTQTVRESVAKPKTQPKKNRIRRAGSIFTHLKMPAQKIRKAGKKEYSLPLPDNKVGRFLNKRRSIIPKYFKESWQELKQVEWPNNRQTMQLTFAVFVFAIAIGGVVAAVDYGLGKAFEALILK